MKVNQIVGEHKKGFRAKKYASKPKKYIEPIKPQGPVKAGDKMDETLGQDVTVKPAAAAQEVDVNGKPIATATDPQTAATLAQLVKTGKLNVSPTQPSSSQGALEEEPAGSDPQMAGLQQLLATEKEPWKQALTKWRIDNLQNTRDIKGTTPTTASGQLKPIVDSETWLKQNPSLISSLPSEALPPNMQQPGMLDRLKQLINYK